MHVQSLPSSYNNPEWEQVFVSIDDADVGVACQAWFAQLCQIEAFSQNYKKHYFECMPALHALSNRLTANIDALMDQFDDDDDPLCQKFGYLSARGMITCALIGAGWQGMAMRCWTDPKAYAGYLQYVEREGLYSHIDDLSDSPYAGAKLKEALDLYANDLGFPWIGAACIRWALFGKDTDIADLPLSVQWLKSLYGERQRKDYWTPREVLFDPVDFGQHANVIRVLLESPDLWTHLFLQEGFYMQDQETIRLWLHWAKSVGHECTQEQEWYDNGDYLAFTNRLLHGDGTELEVMQLLDLRGYLLQKALRHHDKTEATLDLPNGVESPSTGF